MILEFCDTPETWERGLMYRESLEADRVLLFPSHGEWTYFHMHCVRFPILIAALDDGFKVMKWDVIEPETGRFWPPPAAPLVVEASTEFLKTHPVAAGEPFPGLAEALLRG